MIGGVVSALGLGFVAWLIVTDAPTYRFLVRLYEDKHQVHAMVDRWGGWAPIVFIGIQALQVIIAPIPGDVTGLGINPGIHALHPPITRRDRRNLS